MSNTSHTARLMTAATFVLASTALCANALAADWNAVKAALNPSGNQMTNDELRSELVRTNFDSLSPVAIPRTPASAANESAPGPVAPLQVKKVALMPVSPQAQTKAAGSVTSVPPMAAKISPASGFSSHAPAGAVTVVKRATFNNGTAKLGASGSMRHVTMRRTQQGDPSQVAMAREADGNSIGILMPELKQVLGYASVRRVDSNGTYALALRRPDDAELATAGRGSRNNGEGSEHIFYFEKQSDGSVKLYAELALEAQEVKQVAEDVQALGLTMVAAPNQLIPSTGLQHMQVFFNGDQATLMNNLESSLGRLEADLGYAK